MLNTAQLSSLTSLQRLKDSESDLHRGCFPASSRTNTLLVRFIWILLVLLLQTSPAWPDNEILYEFTESHVEKLLGYRTVTSTLIGSDQSIWLATVDGIARYQGERLEEIDIEGAASGGLPESRFVSFLEDEHGAIYVVSRSGNILVYD